MKSLLRFTLPLGLVALIAAGCNKNSETAVAPDSETVAPAPSTAATPAASTTTANAKAAPAAARVVEIQGTDAMKFSVTRIEATAGEQLQVKLVNAGTLPKEAMGHNFVLLKKSANAQTFANAALTAKATEYIPANLKDQVIAHTKLLGPKESDTVTFTVPTEPGEYPYICSFPAHAAAGMKGVLVVK